MANDQGVSSFERELFKSVTDARGGAYPGRRTRAKGNDAPKLKPAEGADHIVRNEAEEAGAEGPEGRECRAASDAARANAPDRIQRP